VEAEPAVVIQSHTIRGSSALPSPLWCGHPHTNLQMCSGPVALADTKQSVVVVSQQVWKYFVAYEAMIQVGL
jgi:hypothetical protein